MLPRLRARAGGCRKWDFWAKMGSKLLNSCEPARPADTNAAPKGRLCAYLFATYFVFLSDKVSRIFCVCLNYLVYLKLSDQENDTPIPYITGYFQQFHRSETSILSVIFQASVSSPAVQQLWTLYPGKQTANLMTNTQTPPPATTVVNTTGAPVTNTVANHAERPEKFNGQNFKRWQQKMFFYLTTLGLARFLKETVPQVEPPAEGQSSNAQAVQAVEAWKHSDFLCHNYVLNGCFCHVRFLLECNDSQWRRHSKVKMLTLL
ncbi:hypothetical protein Tco_1275474 [Tanacetum coccineum]